MTDKFDELNNFYKAEAIDNPWGLAFYLHRKHGKNSVAEYAAALQDTKTQSPGGKDNPGGKKPSPRKGSKRKTNRKQRADLMSKHISLSQNVDKKQLIKEDKLEKKISPGLAALAGWYISGDVTRGMGQATPAQQREFERQIQRAMRNKGRRLRKDEALEKMQQFFSTKDNADTYVRRAPVQKGVDVSEADLIKTWFKSPPHQASVPPFAGARFDPTSRRWVKPENLGQTVQARGGKKRIRGTGTGVHERSVSGHGKGRIRGEGAGRKFKGETDVSAQRRKEGFTHQKVKTSKKEKQSKSKRR
tara:strand:+ start:2264 stop:3172 length:909 start_codon:yes stop_codon:yes gene_type:complete